MKRFGSMSLAFFAIVCVVFATERRALGFSGYVDPGSGLLALQCITSVGVAALYYLRRRIASLFGSKKSQKPLVGQVSGRPDNTKNAA